ncbi:MAG: glycosyltransferase [Lachnospiraceae bacterium]|nr:glycosyltransferase [Lachnospiraceae bacterium]
MERKQEPSVLKQKEKTIALPSTIDVIIPVCKPDGRLASLLRMLLNQSVRPQQILLVNTERDWLDPHLLDGLEITEISESGFCCGEPGSAYGPGSTRDLRQSPPGTVDAQPVIWLMHIRKEEFDHGGTRHMAASMLQGDGILFLTQDALPADGCLIEHLRAPFADPRVGAAYARQLPRQDCKELERYSRSFNYPPQSRMKTEEDLRTMGIKAFFCSNVCAMYRRSTYEALGGFERHTIFNEDMIFAGKMMQSGMAIAYCADAEVVHSHNYSGIQQFHRNFDLGVSQAEHPEIFSCVHSESEGVRLIEKSAKHLIRKRMPWLIFSLIWQSGCKYLGYCLGKNYRRLPDAMVRRFSMNKNYWNHGKE